VHALAAWAATHASLQQLILLDVRLDNEAALDAVVNLAIAKLQYLALSDCQLSPASLTALTRMLESSSLLSLTLADIGWTILTGPTVPAFCAALRSSRLVELQLRWISLWESLEDGLAIVAACTGHPTLRRLCFWGNDTDDPAPAAVGIALAALVAADSALESLDVSDCSLDYAALRPLFAAVAHSTRLRKLDCSVNHISESCAREAILPAVQANTSLRELVLDNDNHELEKAMGLVRARV